MTDAANHFNPNAPRQKSNNIFGLPFTEEESELILIPVPWEVTVSYRQGTSRGPEQIAKASLQVDLFDPDFQEAWRKGYYMLEIDSNIRNKSDYLRSCAELIVGSIYNNEPIKNNAQLCDKMNEANEGGQFLLDWLYELTGRYLKKGKKVGLVGGDHSIPFGYLKALANQHDNFGILHIDAHADLRDAYEGFTFSHASIMHNILENIPQVSRLVQIGVRDFTDTEFERIQKSEGKIKTFFDRNIKEQQFAGKSWGTITDDIIAELPEKVYISFDIDGLDPKLCPNTETPVPGGFEMEQMFYLFKKIRENGKSIIGFDLNEVSAGTHGNDCIDPIVGAYCLFNLCNNLAVSK